MRKIIVGAAIVLVAVVVVWKLQHRGGASAPGTGSATAVTGPRLGRGAAVATPASVSGRVTRKSDGAGVPNAVVALSSSDMISQMVSEAPPVVVVADATGAWTASKVAPGSYFVAATANGYLPAQVPKLWLAAGEQRGGVNITLDAGGTLVHGTVTDIGGGPIGGAHVAVRRSDQLDLSSAELFTVTGTDGTYQLTLADGGYHVSVTHDDYTRGSHDLRLAGTPMVVDFVLTPGGTVRGVVIARDTGKPVPSAMIGASSRHSRGGRANAVADGDGAFIVHGLASGVVSISASGRGYASASPTTIQVGIGEQVDGVRVLVDHALSISGTIVKKGTHVGLPGIRIGVFSMAGGKQAMAPEPSAADGTFEIVGVRPGSYVVIAFGENTVPELGKAIEVVDKDVTGVEVEMGVGVTISGRVEPPQAAASIGVSLAGEVGLANMMAAMKTIAIHADTDANGAFVLHNVPAGAFKITASTSDGHTGSTPILVTDADQAGIVVNLEARASVSGRVIDTNNAPVAGVEVSAVSMDDRQSSSVSFSMGRDMGAMTAADGSFKIVGLDAGKYAILAADDRFQMMAERGTSKKKDVVVELAAGVEHTGVVVTMEARDGVIRGVVIGSDGKVAPDAWVTAKRDRSKSVVVETDGDGDGASWLWNESTPVLTGPDGTFTIAHLRHGTYAVIADGPRGSSRVEKDGVKTGDSITLTLQPLGTLTGHVMNGGAPLAQYDLECRGPAGPVDRDVAAADGSYSFEHLAPGPYDCKASSDAGTATGKVDVPAGAAQLELSLVPWASLTGTVVSMFSEAPVPGLMAIASFDGKAMVAAMTGSGPMTDATGRFNVERVAAGSGSLVLMNPASTFGNDVVTRPFTATQGQRVDLGIIKVVPPRQGDAGTLGLTVTAADNVASVTAVKAGGPAEAAGVQVGDKLVSIDGQPVSALGVTPAVQFLSSGQIGVGVVVALGLDRGGTAVQATVTSVKW